MKQTPQGKTFTVISLGCPKNLVDSEYISGKLEDAGYTLADNGDLVVINTCAFIGDAAQESIETILEEANRTREGKKIVVTGCLVERYGNKLPGLLPEVGLFVGRGLYPDIHSLAEHNGFFPGNGMFSDTFPRKVLTERPLAYLKIQEGCDNRCSYCTIPSIRGSLRSRPHGEITEEFRWLLDRGFREINIVGQDITSYGKDIGFTLVDLLKEMTGIGGDYFLRLLYMHPRGVSDELLDLIAHNERIVKYLDIPIQHSEDTILHAMNRSYTKDRLVSLLDKIRRLMPESVVRTTLMVGFPGETDDDFARLYQFAEESEFDLLGVFPYSKEEGTPAYRMKGHVRKGVKRARYEAIMELQQGISKKRFERFVGQHMDVIVEKAEGNYNEGRLLIQAPDIDGLAFIRGQCTKGDIVRGKIVKTLDYDVIVEV